MKFFNKNDTKEMQNFHKENNINEKNYNDKENNYNYKENNSNDNLWLLQNINLKENSLLQFLKEDEKSNISGLTLPWIYLGMIFSTFCWHVEDLYLYSLNYMHYGSPKIWYSLPINQKEKMNLFLEKKYKNLNTKNKNLIDRLTLLIDPLELIENGIQVNRTIQYPGDIILTMPNSFHAGFSTGFNIAEAINFSVNTIYIKIYLFFLE
jgi:histone demethylase JARID1